MRDDLQYMIAITYVTTRARHARYSAITGRAITGRESAYTDGVACL